MAHRTYDRFQGCWWGATVAQSWLTRPATEPQNPDWYSQPWLTQRQKIAIALLGQNSSTQDFADFTNLPLSTAPLQHNSSLLSLLPLIIFTSENSTMGLNDALKSNLKSVDKPVNIIIYRDRLGWKYLLNVALNNRFEPIAQRQVIEEAIKHNQQTESLFPAKLRLVFEAIEHGHSFNLVLEQLLTLNEPTSSAIALAWYCFATTPQDFKLSIQRAALIPQKLAWLTVALTGTLSGAYNGMTEISAYSYPHEQNPQEQSEHRLFGKLFENWLGILSDDRHDRAYDPNLNAIALTGVMQPRQSLKIISQTFKS